MTQSKPVTKQVRSAALTTALREQPPRIRFTRGMATAAKRLETNADQQSSKPKR